MKKLVSTIALLAVILVAVSGYNGSGSKIAVGDKVPPISINNDYNSLMLNQTDSQYTLLTFWSSADAQSRIDCNVYSAWFVDNGSDQIRHIAINFDNYHDLFSDIVAIDGLDDSAQYYVNGLEAAQIRMDFGLNEGYGSILISPDGRIASFNPSGTELSSLI